METTTSSLAFLFLHASRTTRYEETAKEVASNLEVSEACSQMVLSVSNP